jgi:hypothetical protein
MNLPDFLIVGTMKSGTSTLGHYLNQHENIYMPVEEVHFFDACGGYKDRWEKGVNWYSKQFVKAKPDQLIGEKTPTYSYLNDVPEQIFNTLPNVKIIWIFRNPIDRAYSNYWHAVRNGGEKESFEYAVKYERERIKKNIWYGYIKRSTYIEQVENYLKYFKMDDMLFLTFENLKNNPSETIKKTCDFLGVEFQLSMISKKEAKNKTYLPKYPSIRYLFANLFGSASIVSKIERKINRKKDSYPKMGSELREELKNHFREPNKELSRLTGLDIGTWEK